MKFHGPAPDPVWDKRIERFAEHVKGTLLLLPRNRNTFGMLMALASLANAFFDRSWLRLADRLPRPEQGGSDEDVADALMDAYDDLLDKDGKVLKVHRHRYPVSHVVEEITEERMVQIAAVARNRHSPGRVQSALFLAKLLGAKVDFEFSEFPTTPYSHGIQKHIDEGIRMGLFSSQYGVRLKDKALLSKVEPKLAAIMHSMQGPNRHNNTVGLAAAILFEFSRKRWGKRMFTRVVNRRFSMCGSWRYARGLVATVIRKGKMDMSFIPSCVPVGMYVPKLGSRSYDRRDQRNFIQTWWMEIMQIQLRAFRFKEDIGANGLWSLWPYS